MSDAQTSDQLDHELIVKFKSGDEAAFTALVSRNKEKAVQIAYTMVGNYEDAKDIAQDAFVKSYKALQKFEMKSKFSTWFYRILMNTAKDHFRKKKWQKMISWKSDEDMTHFMESVSDGGAKADQGAMSGELKEQMKLAIRTLPEKQRAIFTLRFLEGMSLKEICEVVNSSEGTVKSSLHFAVQKFKKEMAAYVKP